ncbi:MAG: AAA family ATPase [Candidatus Komeilibacteria bacterium]|nr:AAA family ATPase [Candidatus Komeilibacteria bacterium]
MAKLILGLAGKLSSGKGTIAKYLQENHQAEILMFSTPLRDVLDRFYLPQTRDNMQGVSKGLRESLGQDVIARVIAEDAKKMPDGVIVVDGVRRPMDIVYLKELPGFYLIKIEAEQTIRHQRLNKRGQNPDDQSTTFEEFQKKDAAEAESLIDEVAQEAKFIINNNGTKEELFAQIEVILKKLT